MRASSSSQLFPENQEEEELFVLEDADIEDEIMVVDELYDDVVLIPASTPKPASKAANPKVSPVAKSALPPVAPLMELPPPPMVARGKLPSLGPLPKVTVPPPRPSFRSLPPVNAPLPRPSMLSSTPPAVVTDSSPQLPIDPPTVGSVAVDDLVSAKQRFAMRFGRPNSAWGVALVALGGVLGFVASIAVQPDAPGAGASATDLAAPVVTSPRVDSLPVTAATLSSNDEAAKKPSPTALSFEPVDIQVSPPPAAAAPAAAPVPPQQTGPIMAVAPRPSPPPAAPPAPKPVAKEPSPRVVPEAPKATPKAPEPRVTEPTRTVVARASEPRVPANTADLAPSAVDALVREQLRSSLR